MLAVGGVGAIVPWVFGWRQDLVHSCIGCGKRLGVQEWDNAVGGLGEVEVMEGTETGKAGKAEKREHRQSLGKRKEAVVGGVVELSAEREERVAELGGKSRVDAELEGDLAARELGSNNHWMSGGLQDRDAYSGQGGGGGVAAAI